MSVYYIKILIYHSINIVFNCYYYFLLLRKKIIIINVSVKIYEFSSVCIGYHIWFSFNPDIKNKNNVYRCSLINGYLFVYNIVIIEKKLVGIFFFYVHITGSNWLRLRNMSNINNVYIQIYIKFMYMYL